MNKLAILALVFISLLGITLAATLGMFQATGISNEEMIELAPALEDSASLETAQEGSTSYLAQLDKPMRETEENTAIPHALDEATQTLQEVRDVYISFPQAFLDVVIQFQDGAQCEGDSACVLSPNEIAINRTWAKTATRDEVILALARQHATLAIDRVWGSQSAANLDLQNLIPTCVVERDMEIYAQATNNEVPEIDQRSALSVTALGDVIVQDMTGQVDPNAIYVSQFHTPEQIRVAQEVGMGELPEIVIPVSSPNCEPSPSFLVPER